MNTEPGRVLLPIARAAIARALQLPHQADESAAWLKEPGATFVTLTQQGELRGCIGSLQPLRPLLEDVKNNAVAAALHDPRFMPLTRSEFAITDIEVSLLSTLQPLQFRDEADALAQLQPQVDGIVLEFQAYRSTFLPQVWEQLPHPRDFLGMLKRKAGLPEDFWHEELKLSRYSVSKWKETELMEQVK